MTRTVDTRSKILEVAQTEFATSGYAGAHLQKIAEQIGVQKTALYYYFNSKRALYTAVLEAMLLDFDRTVADALDVEESHTERLDRLVTQLNDLLAEHPNYARILIRIFVDAPEVESDRLSPLIRSVINRVLEFFRAGADAGAFRKLSSRHVFQSVLGMTVFHYAASPFSATVLGVEDIFTRQAVAWRRQEVLNFVSGGAVKNPARDPE